MSFSYVHSSRTRYLRNTIPLPDAANRTSPKIENLVNEISKLTILEVSELNTVLKEKLNIPDMPMMGMGSFVAEKAVPSTEEVDSHLSSCFLML